MYAQHIKQGDDYNKITKCVAILFTDFEIENIKNIKQYITKWNFREETYSKIILTDALELYIIELPKVQKYPTKTRTRYLGKIYKKFR